MSKGLFLAADWPAPDGVVAGTTLRGHAAKNDPFASFNLGAHVGDAAQNVRSNRERLSRDLDLPQEPLWLRQVHGSTVVDAADENTEPEADACVSTGAPGVCAVLTADCLPVLFCHEGGDAVAAAHAGWRGLCNGVLEATVSALNCAPDQLLAWFGPAISQAAFEVGDEVKAAFVEQQLESAACFRENARGRWQADLYALARMRLERAGVTRIFGGDRCTFTEDLAFYSYRRDGRCGRMASLIFRRAD